GRGEGGERGETDRAGARSQCLGPSPAPRHDSRLPLATPARSHDALTIPSTVGRRVGGVNNVTRSGVAHSRRRAGAHDPPPVAPPPRGAGRAGVGRAGAAGVTAPAPPPGLRAESREKRRALRRAGPPADRAHAEAHRALGYRERYVAEIKARPGALAALRELL